MADAVLAQASSAVDKVVAVSTSVAATVADKIDDITIPPEVTGFYAAVFGETTTVEFVKEWLPILYVSLTPLLCIVCALCFSGIDRKNKTGSRVQRRVNLTVKASTRILRSASKNKLSPSKGYKGLADVEKGGSPLKNKAAVRLSRRPA